MSARNQKTLALLGPEKLMDYLSRVVGRFEDESANTFVSTAKLTEESHALLPYETVIAHPSFNDGQMFVVAAYDNPVSAAVGHAEWVAKIAVPDSQLPESITQITNRRERSLEEMLARLSALMIEARAAA